MNVLDTAKEQVRHLAEIITDRAGDAVTRGSAMHAITIGRPKPEVVALFRDPERLSQIFGDVAEVHGVGSDRLHWAFTSNDKKGLGWDCVVILEDETRLRFVDVDPERSAGIELEFRDAPQGRGTEVIARVVSPSPGMLSGSLTFKALYRARALLMTGEIPTIEHNPSARDSDR
jgi:uncharacterized membrane protein